MLAQTSKFGDPGTQREASNSFAVLELELRLIETDTKSVNLSGCFERPITKPSKQEILTTNTSRQAARANRTSHQVRETKKHNVPERVTVRSVDPAHVVNIQHGNRQHLAPQVRLLTMVLEPFPCLPMVRKSCEVVHL